jgi:transposase-like protein/DNA-directed RNA polymerase subunit RPC12/RpoP
MKNEPTKEVKFKNLLDVQKRFPDEKACREYLELARWNGKIVCVHCGSSKKIYRINDGALYKCSACRKNFSIRVGTIFEDSALPLQKWFFAIYVFSSHKKGISSIQLGKDIGVRQATAWHMLHRLREGMKPKTKKPLKGMVEADETYVGGKKKGGKRGRGSENKTPIFGMAERGGDVRTQPVERVNGATLKGLIKANVAPDTTVMTDEWGAYRGLSKDYKHGVVNHGSKEYVNGEIHTNTIESFWALLKRGIFGIYHHVSPEHLHRYCDEFQFRYNSRKSDETLRFASMLGQCEGRLMYKDCDV